MQKASGGILPAILQDEHRSPAASRAGPGLVVPRARLSTGATTRTGPKPKLSKMPCLKFKVRQTGRGRNWVVLVGGKLYGRYLGREEAVLDALDAAEDARRCGRAAEVVGADALSPVL